jgi:signal transduction histidine kinase
VAKLEQLLESQQAFVADASHQLRTPLTALRLRLENLQHGLPAPELAGALAEVDRLARLVNGLLALARADAAALPASSLTLADAVGERLEAWSALAAERDVRLVAGIDGDAEVRASPERLEQVLDNLIANALEAAPPASAVTISTRRARGRIELHVRDEGPGLTAEERARAFDRFWRGRNGSGSGLGLAIVRRLVVADGGDVELLPAPGGGIDAVVRLRPETPSGPVPILAGSLSDRRT